MNTFPPSKVRCDVPLVPFHFSGSSKAAVYRLSCEARQIHPRRGLNLIVNGIVPVQIRSWESRGVADLNIVGKPSLGNSFWGARALVLHFFQTVVPRAKPNTMFLSSGDWQSKDAADLTLTWTRRAMLIFPVRQWKVKPYSRNFKHGHPYSSSRRW